MLLPSIRRCFAGLPKEIILADDRSHPEELRIASQQQGKGVRILLDQGNHGLENCLNLAMAHAQGDILIPVAADMEFVWSRFGRRCFDQLGHGSKVNLVFGKTEELGTDDSALGTTGWAVSSGLLKKASNARSFIKGKTRPTGCAVAFRREFLHGKQYESSLGPYADFYLNNLALLEGDGWFVPEIVSRTLHRPNSYSMKTSEQEFQKYLERLLQKPVFQQGLFSRSEVELFRLRETSEYRLHRRFKEEAVEERAKSEGVASAKKAKPFFFPTRSWKWGSLPRAVLGSLEQASENVLRQHRINPLWSQVQQVVPRPPAGTLPEDRHPHLVSDQDCQRPALWIAELRKADVYGPSVAVVTAGRSLLEEVSVEWARPASDHGVMRRVLPLPGRSLAGLSLLLGSTGGDTYHHWMLDILPRVRLLREAGLEPSDFTHILVHARQAPFQAESLAVLGIDPGKVRSLSRRIRYRCEILVLPSLPAPLGHASRENVDFLRHLFLGSLPGSGHRRLLVGREPGTSRQVSGWREVVPFFQEQGFTEVVPGQLSLQEQATIYSEAEWVVGVHGAALTNLAFCRPGTKVLEILGWDYVNPCYRDLSAAAGLRYHALLGQPPHRSSTANFDLNIKDASKDITIDPQKVARFFRQLEKI